MERTAVGIAPPVTAFVPIVADNALEILVLVGDGTKRSRILLRFLLVIVVVLLLSVLAG